MSEKSIVEQAAELRRIPITWEHQRGQATADIVIRMANEIERLQRIVNHLCPDKSDDV